MGPDGDRHPRLVFCPPANGSSGSTPNRTSAWVSATGKLVPKAGRAVSTHPGRRAQAPALRVRRVAYRAGCLHRAGQCVRGTAIAKEPPLHAQAWRHGSGRLGVRRRRLCLETVRPALGNRGGRPLAECPASQRFLLRPLLLRPSRSASTYRALAPRTSVHSSNVLVRGVVSARRTSASRFTAATRRAQTRRRVASRRPIPARVAPFGSGDTPQSRAPTQRRSGSAHHRPTTEGKGD